MPKVSVIIPTHSRPDLLPRAVESAKNAGTDVEVIVVDDASTDTTAEVCRKFSGIRYVRVDRNQGVAGARNIGLLASSGQFISFHDDDDLRFPGSLDRQVAALKENPKAGICYGPVIMGDQDCNPTGHAEPARLLTGDLFWDLLIWNPIICLSAVFRKDCIYRVGLLDKSLPGFDDWDLWVRISELYHVVAVKEPVGIWRVSTPFSRQGSSDSASHLINTTRHQLELLRLPRAQSDSAEKLKEIRRRRLEKASDWLIWNAAHWLDRGANRYARNNLLTALRLNPMRSLRPWTIKLLLSSLRPTGRPGIVNTDANDIENDLISAAADEGRQV